MAQITLIGKSLAEVGKEFYFEGPNWKCQECKLKNVCFNLDIGNMYRITEVRNQKHECPDFDGDEVVAVCVEKIPTRVAIPKKQAIDGGIITFQSNKCQNIGCDYYQKCRAYGKQEGQKYQIARVYKDIDCPIGEKLIDVELF